MKQEREILEKGAALVVDDDPEINELVGAYAQICGLTYSRAITGAEALLAAKKNTPAVILLDLMLPDMDGFEVCRRLRRDPNTANVPVIMLTAMDREESRQRGMAAGVNDYLTKPFDPDRLMDIIKKHTGEPAPIESR